MPNSYNQNPSLSWKTICKAKYNILQFKVRRIKPIASFTSTKQNTYAYHPEWNEPIKRIRHRNQQGIIIINACDMKFQMFLGSAKAMILSCTHKIPDVLSAQLGK